MVTYNDNLRRHYQVEKEYAARIKASVKGSPERKALIEKANDEILAMMSGYNDGGAFSHDSGFVSALAKAILPKGGSILDFGCGEGDLILSLSKDGYDISGFDVASVNIENAKRKLASAGLADKVFVGDYNDISGKYGAIIMDNVIEHLLPDETSDVLRKCHQLLSDGGQIIVITPHRYAGPHDISKNFLSLGARAEGFHFHEFTATELGEVLGKNGFKSVISYAIHPKLLWKYGLFMKPKRFWQVRSILFEKIFGYKAFNWILKINRNLSRAMVALCCPTVVVGSK